MTSNLLVSKPLFKPFDYPWAVELFEAHEEIHWTTKEAKIAEDVEGWNTGKVNGVEKNHITQTLRVFTQQDKTVADFYTDLLIPRFKNSQIRMMLRAFNNREDVHQVAYALVNDTLGLPEDDYAAFLEYTEMADKIEFAMQCSPDTVDGLALTLAKGVVNEGLSLFASFVMLLNYQRRGLMKGMGKVVEWSIRDESMHVLGVSKLFKTYCQDHPWIVTDKFKASIYQMFRDAVVLEDRFVDLAYAMGPVEGLTAAEVKQYMRFIADYRLTQLGLKPNFNVSNPLPWLDDIISAVDHTNFFEGKVTEYEVSAMDGEWVYPVPRANRAKLTVLTREGCGYCVKAKTLLDLRGVPYQVVDLSDDDERNAWFDAGSFFGPDRTMPKIYEGNRLIGGYTELLAEIDKAS